MKVRIFTDGACSGNPGYGGYAFLIALKSRQIKFSNGECNTTNNRMELKAVIKALDCILKNLSKVKKYDCIEINSDSSYVVNSINQDWLSLWQSNGWKNRKLEDVKNVDLWKEFIEKKKQIENNGFKIELKKVKGHSGNALNEAVDGMARTEALKLKEEGDKVANM